MKDIKEKPTAHMPRSNATGEIPKAALKKAWAEAKEKSRTMLRESTSTQGDGDYTTAQDTSSVVTDTSYSVIKQNTDFTVQQGRKIARKQIEKYRERRSAEQTETTRVHTANERGVSPKQVECGTLSDAERHPRRGADLPRQRAKEKVVTAKTAPRDIRGVTQGQRQLRTAATETVRSITTQAQMQTRTRQVQLAIQKATSSTRKTAVAVRSAIRHFLVSLHSLVAAIAAGISVALSIIIVISLVAFVSGSAYGIFFAANAPNADTITVQQAVETLTAEYRDRLEEISNTVQHDRQDITANDDVYFIRWQDVLAVFSSYVSGNEQGAPVAALIALFCHQFRTGKPQFYTRKGVNGVVDAAVVRDIAAGHAAVCRIDDGIALERCNIALPEIQSRLNGSKVSHIGDTFCCVFTLQIGVLYFQKICICVLRRTKIHQPS